MEFSPFSFRGYSGCEVESVSRVTHRCDEGAAEQWEPSVTWVT